MPEMRSVPVTPTDIHLESPAGPGSNLIWASDRPFVVEI
jgi:hypothetical protein